ncbi:hypothetical protein GQ53DRAFT_837479 [Thozetella sp. PMI_491]|nr:hypothetical protein GQ53DRAFT_837479 [Thozetella sp. PMI_491]
MDGRLRTVCAGLLESSNSQWSGEAPDAKVAFLHRSVADWLATREVWEGIQIYTSGFSPNLSMLKSRILNLKAVLVTPGNPLDMTLASDALWYAKEAERDLDSGFPKLLDEFDKVVSFLWRMGYHGDTAYDPHTTGPDAFEGISAATSQPITMLAPSYRNSSTWTADWDDTKFRGSRLLPAAHAGLLGAGMDTFDEVESMVMRRNFLGSSSLTGLAPQGLRGNTLYHWTYAVDLPGIKPVGKASTFYDVVKALGLDHYVRMKCESGTIMDQDVSQHLLIQAITSTTTNSANVASVIRLLESGADPNIPYNGQAAWEYAMTNALSHLKRAGEATHPPDAEWERKAKAWISIFSAFVAHGADPEAVVRRPIGLQGPLFLDASDVIDKYLSYVLSDEAVALKLVLAKTRNSSRDH